MKAGEFPYDYVRWMASELRKWENVPGQAARKVRPAPTEEEIALAAALTEAAVNVVEDLRKKPPKLREILSDVARQLVEAKEEIARLKDLYGVE